MQRVLTFVFLVFFSSLLFGGDSLETEIVITYPDGRTELRYIRVDIDRIRFIKEDIVSVVGLERLTNVKILEFSRMPHLKDLNFLRNLDHIEVVVLRFVDLENIDFINSMENLKALIIQSSYVDIEPANIVNSNIEYLEISNSYLSSFPLVSLTLENLFLINISNNDVVYIDDQFLEKNPNITILAEGNPGNFGRKNTIITSNHLNCIPENYQEFIQ